MDCIIVTKDGKKHKGIIRKCFADGLFRIDSGSLRFIPRNAKITNLRSDFVITKIENFDYETLKYKRVFLNAVA